ncbi:MAG: hypothetical protein RLZZ299_1848 [Pseudomonadota bacterium]
MPRRLLPIQSLLLALVVTWPTAWYITRAAVGSAHSDTPKHLWTLWWMRREWLDGPWGLQTTLVNAPDGMPLYPIEPLHGLLALLLQIPVVPLSNLLAIANVTLVGICTGWLGWLVSRRPAGALVAGALAQTGSFVAFTLHVGVGELRQVWWIPLGLGLLLHAQEQRALRWFALLGATLGLATVSCFYHGFFLGIALAVVALCTLRADPALGRGYALAVGIALAIIVPIVRTFSHSYAPDDQAVAAVGFLEWMGTAPPLETYPRSSLEPWQLVVTRAVDFSHATRQAYAYGGGRYLGWITIGLAVAGAWQMPRRALPWIAVGLTGIVFAMGTVLWWGDAIVQPRIVLPLAVLNHALAWFGEPLNFPVRFLALTTIATSILAALGTTRRWMLALVPLAMIDVNRNALAPWPRNMMVMADLSPVEAPEGAVADFTFALRENVDPLRSYDAADRFQLLGAQVWLDRPMQIMPVERVELWGTSGIRWTAALPLAALVRGASVDEDGVRASTWLLRERGFRSVVVTHACDANPERGFLRSVSQVLGEPARGRCGLLWKLPAVEASPAESARWTEEQATRLDALQAQITTQRGGAPPPP